MQFKTLSVCSLIGFEEGFLPSLVRAEEKGFSCLQKQVSLFKREQTDPSVDLDLDGSVEINYNSLFANLFQFPFFVLSVSME